MEQTNLVADEAIAKADAMASGSPKGVYTTLALLQAAYPTGTTGAYLVTADGKWYYWSGSAWTPGGLYQSQIASADKVAVANADKYFVGTNQEIVDKEIGEQLQAINPRLENIIKNGGFIDTSSWVANFDSVTLSAASGILTATGTGTNANPQFKQEFSVQTGRVYLKGSFKVNSLSCTKVSILITNGALIDYTDFVLGEWYDFEVDCTGTGITSAVFIYRFADAASSLAQTFDIKNVLLINLNDTFGYANNTVKNYAVAKIKEQPNAWFDKTLSLWGKNIPYDFFNNVNTLRNFGAIGDGYADDTVAIQKALDKGGFIFVGDGVFKITGTLTLKSHTRLFGLGDRSKFILGDGYVLTGKLWSAEYGVNYYPYLTTAENSQDVVIENIFIEGNKNAAQFTDQLQVGLAIESAKNVTINNVHIGNVNYFPSLAPPRPSGQWRTGWNFGVLRSDGITVNGGLFEYGGYECFRVTEFTKNLTLRNAKLQYGWRTVFQITSGCENIEISKCTINQDDFGTNDTHAAITLHGTTYGTIKNVLIKDNKINAALFQGAPTIWAISFVDMYNQFVRIVDNDITSNGGGIGAYGEKIEIEDNNIVATNGHGVQLDDTLYADNTVIFNRNNIISSKMALLLEVATAKKVSIVENVLESTTEHAIYAYHADMIIDKWCKVVNNTLIANALKNGVNFVSRVENGIFTDNVVSKGAYGIRLAHPSSVNNIVALNNVKKTTSGIVAGVGDLVVNNLLP